MEEQLVRNALDYHRYPTPGKISVMPTKSMSNQRDLALAIEMGSDAADIGLTVHPHPTLSETVGMAAEAFEGTITDLMPPKRKK